MRTGMPGSSCSEHQDFPFSETVSILREAVPSTSSTRCRRRSATRTSSNGNSQTLDEIMVSFKLFRAFRATTRGTLERRFQHQDSDHDPQVSRFHLAGAVRRRRRRR